MNRLLTAVALVGLLTTTVHAEPFSFREPRPGELELLENDKPVYVYRSGPVLAEGFPESMRRSCYLHPVYAPDGTLLSDDFNKDHPHHRGISWMWPSVTFDGKKGDMWTLIKDFQAAVRPLEGPRDTRRNNGKAVGGGKRLVRRRPQKFVAKEEVEILTLSRSKNDAAGVMYFTLRFEATVGPTGRDRQAHRKGRRVLADSVSVSRPRDGGAEKTTVIRTDKGVSAIADGVLEPTSLGRAFAARFPRQARWRLHRRRSPRIPGIPTTAGFCGTGSGSSTSPIRVWSRSPWR